MARNSSKRQEMEGDNSSLKTKCRWAPMPSHIDSSQVCQLMCPPPGIREIMQRNGVTPKNHFRDNRAAITQKSALNHAMKQAAIARESTPPLPKPKVKPMAQPIRRTKENEIDFVSRNMHEAAQNGASRRVKKPEPSIVEKHKDNFGKIPSYLLQRKLELAQAMEEKVQSEKGNKLPPGYVEMSEDEKNEVLKALRENKAVLEKKLSGLPLYCETPSQIRNRSTIDGELQDVENAIKRFTRPHVYLSLND